MTTTIESCGVLCHCPDYMPDDRFDVEDYPGGRPCCWCKCTAIEHRSPYPRQKISTHDEALREQLEAWKKTRLRLAESVLWVWEAVRAVADELEEAERKLQEQLEIAEARVKELERAAILAEAGLDIADRTCYDAPPDKDRCGECIGCLFEAAHDLLEQALA